MLGRAAGGVCGIVGGMPPARQPADQRRPYVGAARLPLALEAGHVGTWHWDAAVPTDLRALGEPGTERGAS